MMRFVTVIALFLVSATAFAFNFGFIEPMMKYVTLENVLAGIGVVSVVMTGVPVPQAGTKLFKVYTVLKYLSGNFGFADHTKKK